MHGRIALGTDAILPPGMAREQGGDVIIGLRPEHLSLESGGGTRDRARFDAVLEAVEPLGNEMFLHLRFGRTALIARVPPMPLPEPGTALRLGFTPERLHFFNARTMERID
jgi:multiple sugar transport system ATP-binding protein